MKILITENRLDKVIDTYITSQLGELDKKLEKVDSTVNRFVFKDKHGEVIMIILEGMDRKPIVGISEYVYKSLNNLIGLNDFCEIQKYFKKWFKNHMGIDLYGVETFSRGQDEYFF
jgi:hypothetical protein